MLLPSTDLRFRSSDCHSSRKCLPHDPIPSSPSTSLFPLSTYSSLPSFQPLRCSLLGHDCGIVSFIAKHTHTCLAHPLTSARSTPSPCAPTLMQFSLSSLLPLQDHDRLIAPAIPCNLPCMVQMPHRPVIALSLRVPASPAPTTGSVQTVV